MAPISRLASINVFVLLFGSFFFSTAAYSAQGQFHRVNILMERLFTEYQMLKGEQGDPRYSEQLNTTLGEYQAAVDELSLLMNSANMSELLIPITPELTAFKDLLIENKEALESGGFEEFALVDEMVQHKNDVFSLISQARKSYESSAGINRSISAEEARDLSVIMQKLAARYIENSAAAFGISYRDQSDEKNIDELANSFSERLQELHKQNADNPEITRALAKAATKWRFIEKSMINIIHILL